MRNRGGAEGKGWKEDILKGQVAFEFYIVLAFALLIFGVISILAYSTYNSYIDSLNMAQAQSAAQGIVDAAEKVRGEGNGSKTTVVIVIPPSILINESYIGSKDGVGRTINIRIALSDGGEVDVYANSRVDVEGEFPSGPGSYRLYVEHREGKAVVYR